ncbi:unnamed protein product, partial [Medioppia subpectinata]
SKEVHVLSDGYKQSSVKHTEDVGSVEYTAPEGQTTEYNHLIDVYSLALIGAQLFGFNTSNIENGNFQYRGVHIQQVYLLLTRDQIQTKLTQVANSDEYNGDAFIMMFIGDGYNENIIGYRDPNDTQLPPENHNLLPISDIVATFAWTRAPVLRYKTKVFIFNCDRLKVDVDLYKTIVTNDFCVKSAEMILGHKEPALINKLTMLDPQFKHDNNQIYVIYSCREGYASWHRPVDGPIGNVTQFGQTFSHTIAQYSSYKSLIEMFVMIVEQEPDNTGDDYDTYRADRTAHSTKTNTRNK